MTDFTVAIRTYNGEKRLPAVLDRLRSQIGTENITWEIVIVDNNSTDNTAKIIQDYQSSWPETHPIKYYFEAQQGAFFARKRAIKEAKSSLIGFLDDDNWPESNWVAEAYLFGQSHPKAGAYGSQIHGDFELNPPENFDKIASFLPIIERKKTICFNNYKYSKKLVLPPGAGLVIRKEAWQENVPEFITLQGPVGNCLAAKGEDIETLTYIKKSGWEIWFNAEMHIYHHIPGSRFEREYLIKFFRGIGLSRYRTRMFGYEAWQRPFMLPAYMANDLRKILNHYLKNRKQLGNDLVADCLMELFISSFFSPFYTFNNLLKTKK